MLDDKTWLNLAKSKNVKLDMEIKNRIITRCFDLIKIFQHVMIYILLELTYFGTKQINADMPKKGPQGLHLILA